jgi:hypothetical protein
VQLLPVQISASIDDITGTVCGADHDFSCSNQEDLTGDIGGFYEADAKWKLQMAFTKLLALAEVVGLSLLRADIAEYYQAAKTDLLAVEYDPSGDPHLRSSLCIRCYLAAIQSSLAYEPARTITRDLESILRGTAYSICDTKIFGGLPKNETDVHGRIECILKCVFPDLKHKPSLSKPIKNFVPDTGIPSINTLIEYKFLDDRSSVGRITDELLADSRGYHSPDWSSVVYVIYETSRFKPEHEWRTMLRENGVDSRSSVIVLAGESA